MATTLKHAGLPPRDPFPSGGLMNLGQVTTADGGVGTNELRLTAVRY